VTILDSGGGSAAEHLLHIFDRVFRIESRSRATGGSGLGLAIVKQLVELRGGKVWVERQPDKGNYHPLYADNMKLDFLCKAHRRAKAFRVTSLNHLHTKLRSDLQLTKGCVLHSSGYNFFAEFR
jgi:signal transduction histidine kinase